MILLEIKSRLFNKKEPERKHNPDLSYSERLVSDTIVSYHKDLLHGMSKEELHKKYYGKFVLARIVLDLEAQATMKNVLNSEDD